MSVTIYTAQFPSEMAAYREGRPFTWLDTQNTIWPVGWSEITILDRRSPLWIALDAGKVARYSFIQLGWRPLNDEIADAFAEEYPDRIRHSTNMEVNS